MSKNGLRNKRNKTIILNSLEDTFDFGLNLGKKAKANDVFCFFGPLGAGKTTLIKAIAKGADLDPSHVCSPTFSYLNIYDSPLHKIYHFDLYRLKNEKQFLSLGFQEFLCAGGISCIEWSERIEPLLSDLNVIKVTLKILDDDKRSVEVDDGAY